MVWGYLLGVEKIVWRVINIDVSLELVAVDNR